MNAKTLIRSFESCDKEYAAIAAISNAVFPEYWNATVNEGMLGINVKLGFVRQPAWVTFVRKL